MLNKLAKQPYWVALVYTMAIILGSWWLLLGCGQAAMPASTKADLVVTRDITVGPEQTVGKMLVVNGNATIKGHVTGWLTVINGNLTIAASARLDGSVLVLGGQLTSEPGAAVITNLTVIPNNSPFIFYLLNLLIIGAAGFLLLAALALWFLERWIAYSPTWQKLLGRISKVVRRKPWLLVLAGFGISALAMAGFVEIAEATIWQREMDLLDNIVIWLVRYFANPTVDKTMIFITNLGYGWILLAIAATVSAWLASSGYRAGIISLLLCLAGSTALNLLLKHLFSRARPDLFQMVEAYGYSFPSGHAMVALCFYGMLAYLIGRRLRKFVWRLPVYGLALTLVTAIGLSRIYLGVHYPTDVLAGYIAGITWLAICVSLHVWWEHRS